MYLNRRAIFLLAVTLCFLGGRYVVSSGSQSHAALTGAPDALKAFTVHQRELSFPRQRNQPPAETNYTIAQSSNRSRVREYTISARWAPEGKEGMVIDVWDIPKRRYINVEPFTQSVSTFHMSDDEISDLIHSERACEGIRSSLASGNLPSKTVLRHKAYQIVSQEDDVEVTSWVDPDLNCLPLEKTEVFSSGAKNVITVLKIVEGEPPDSMFKPPAGYMERSPARVETVYEKMFAGKELYPKRMVEHAESEYHKGR